MSALIISAWYVQPDPVVAIITVLGVSTIVSSATGPQLPPLCSTYETRHVPLSAPSVHAVNGLLDDVDEQPTNNANTTNPAPVVFITSQLALNASLAQSRGALGRALSSEHRPRRPAPDPLACWIYAGVCTRARRMVTSRTSTRCDRTGDRIGVLPRGVDEGHAERCESPVVTSTSCASRGTDTCPRTVIRPTEQLRSRTIVAAKDRARLFDDRTLDTDHEWYTECRDYPSKSGLRRALSRIWGELGEFIPEPPAQFLSEFRKDFPARSWELYMLAFVARSGCTLERGPPRAQTSAPGSRTARAFG